MALAQNEVGGSLTSGSLACVLYLVLFPAFFAYHLLAALGVIPLFAGAWWGVSTLVCLIVLGFFAAKKALESGPWIIHGPVLALAVLVSVSAFYYKFWGHDWQRDQEMFLGSIKLLIAWGGLYCVGFLLEYDERLQKASAICLGGMAVSAFLLIDPLDISFVPTEWVGVVPGIAGYQWFSQAVLFTGIISLSYAKRQSGQIITLAAMDATLFLTASRSDLIAAVAVTIGWFVIQAFRGRFRDIVPAALTLAITASFVALYPSVYLTVERTGPSVIAYLAPGAGTGGIASPDQRPDAPATGATRTETVKRYAELADLGSSPSMLERNKYFWSGLEGIKNSPLIGDYGGQIRDHGNYGAYMHNMLGVWRDYGIVSFVVFALLTSALPLIAMWHVLWKGSDDPMWFLALYAGGVILIASLAVKAVYWPLPAFAWGLLAANTVRERAR